MEEIKGRKITENIYACPDGKYRWIYELNMLTNPIILLTIWKLFFILILIQLLFSFLIELFEGNAAGWFTDYLLSPGVLIVPGIMFVLSIIAYLIVAAIYGWKYIVLFEMDDKGIDHIQMQKQFEKAQGLAWLTAMAGFATNNFTTAGAGVLAGSKSTSSSTFANVKKLISQKGLHCIRANELLEKNQIYVADEDYEFVWDYMAARCTNAKIKR
ncbi:hypothetical protein [Butyrivibrio sp. XPD2006]|uniref:hypothetical protein n=1 Tax=Butyrivibrio sp. XPD2006 TaxID=1280668 RepID=UPI0003B46AE6|nr:hypothetical protein [Butyrivibrio sp. XPD2006]